MKKTLSLLLTAVAISTAAPAMARHHAASPNATIKIQQTNNDDGTPAGATAIVAFSDTTDTDTAGVDTAAVTTTFITGSNSVPQAMMEEFSRMMGGAVIPITVVLLIFFLAPVVIIALLVYYLLKSRRQKIQLAELAIRSGQPLPPDILAEYGRQRHQALWEKGLTKMFVGIGIVVFALFIDSDFFKGAGFLLAFYGAGQAAIAFTSKKKGTRAPQPDDAHKNDGETQL